MDFMKEYEKWLASPALSDAERAELEGIRNDPKEIESRFYGPLELSLIHISIATPMALVPAWCIVTDTASYYVNCYTGTVSAG